MGIKSQCGSHKWASTDFFAKIVAAGEASLDNFSQKKFPKGKGRALMFRTIQVCKADRDIFFTVSQMEVVYKYQKS